MNKLLILFSFFIFHFSLSYAQEKRMCNAETLVNKPDVIIQKDYVNISKVAGITVSVEAIIDLNN
ncbi:MAG TPA: hypothetical protein VNZ45_03970, partial [Bacteroidia bacterium]|nr:hypothetical protein [Bacteroidia bacterium]